MKSYIVEDVHEDDSSMVHLLKRWVAVILIACAVFLTIHTGSCLLEEFALRGTSGFVKINNLEYIKGSKKNDLANSDHDWILAKDGYGIVYDRDETFTRIRMKVKTDEYYNAVFVKTDHSVLNVECDGLMLLENKSERSYSDNKFEIIKLPTSKNEQTLEITAFSPYTFRFSAFMVNYEKTSENASLLGYTDIFVGGVITITAFIILCFFIVLYGRKRIKLKEMYLPFILLLAGVLLLLDPPFSVIFKGKLENFKMSVTVASFLFVCTLLENILDKKECDDFIEKVGGMNIIYVLAIVLSPYDILFTVLVKMFTLLLAIDIVAYTYIIEKHCINGFNIVKEAVFAAFVICSFMYWYSLLQRLKGFFGPDMIVSFILCIVVLLYFVIVNKRGILPEVKAKKEFKNKEIIKNIPSNELLDVKRLATAFIEKIRDMKIPDENAVTIFNEAENVLFEGEGSDALNFKLKNIIHHSIKVAEYSRIIALTMGYSSERAVIIGKAALLHDIGKLVVNYSILTKEEMLTEKEFAEIRLHTQYGYEIISCKKDEFFEMAAVIAKEHHERYNGTGYQHLRGEEIQIEARIVAIADVFDAMTSQRSYKSSWSFEQVFDYVIEHSDNFFDAKIIERFKLAKNDLMKCYAVYHLNEPKI